jgi:hypothetical protein
LASLVAQAEKSAAPQMNVAPRAPDAAGVFFELHDRLKAAPSPGGFTLARRN